MAHKDYYDILGIKKDASLNEIRQAFRKLAQKHHPDKGGGDVEKFKEINQAYQILSNPEKRKMYDQYGSAFEQVQSRGGAGGFDNFADWAAYAQAMRGSGANVNFEDLNFGGLGSIFEDVFGFSKARTQHTYKAENIELELVLDLEQAVFGFEKIIKLDKYIKCDACDGKGYKSTTKFIICNSCNGKGQSIQQKQTFFGTFQTVSTCSNCNGQGKIPEKNCEICHGKGRIKKLKDVKIKIPAGIDHGQTIKFKGQGQAGEKGIHSGDLYVIVSIRSHPKFKRQGSDIFSKKEISISQAVLGSKIDIQTLHGEVSLKIPSGTQSGQQFYLKNKGVPQIGLYKRTGNQIVEVNIKIPKHLTKEQKKLLKGLSEQGL